MNPIIRAQMAKFSEVNNCAKLSEFDQFEHYCAQSILQGEHGESVSSFDVVLGNHEFGIDGLAILIQGELIVDTEDAKAVLDDASKVEVDFFFFQSKTSEKFNFGDIAKFCAGVEEFFEQSPDFYENDLKTLCRIKDLIYENAAKFKRNPSIQMYYAATGKYSHPVRTELLLEKTISTLTDKSLFERISMHVIGAQELQDMYRRANTAITVELSLENKVVLPESDFVSQSFLGYVSGKSLLNIFCVADENGELTGINGGVFYDNIRDYNPDSDINSGIRDSIVSGDARDFVFKNNGITVVARNINLTGNRIRMEDYQIVNGCQTANVLFDCRSELKDDLCVPIRIIEAAADEFVSSVIISTNRQNPVREEQFWALKPFLKSFEEYCAALDKKQKLHIERRENQYRGMENLERFRIVKPATLFKAVVAMFFFQPHRAGRDYRGVRKNYADNIFLDDHDVRIYHVACLSYVLLDSMWRNGKLRKEWSIYRYYILYALGSKHAAMDLFGKKSSEVSVCVKDILQIALNESKLATFVEKVGTAIDSVFEDIGETRHRDQLRTDDFFKQAADKIDAIELATKS